MKPLKKLALVPMLALLVIALAQVAVPAAHGDDTVKVRASILFTLDGVRGYVRYGEPVVPRIIERVAEPLVVYVYREPPRPVVVHEIARPVVIVTGEHHDNGRAFWERRYEKKHHAKRVVLIDRNDRGHDRNIVANAGPNRYENRNEPTRDRDTRVDGRQVTARRNGKAGRTE